MNNILMQRYKINKSPIEKSFEKQIGLKMNEEYKKWANNTAIELIEYFCNRYKGVKIEIPKMREKSPKSLLGKIKNLQIERLSKLYALEGISDEDKKELYARIEERIYENEDLDSLQILKVIKKLIYTNEIDIDEFENNIMVEGISKSTKTALLRILVGKIEKSNLLNKQKQLDMLDEKYGEKAVIKTGLPESDIIRYSSIRSIKGNNTKISRLKNEMQFLKANDLRGMKIVVVDISDDFITENEKINQLLEKRKSAKTSQERLIYTHKCIAELGKEFYNDLANNEQLLERTHMNVIPDSNKHKKKSNGYEAEHIKFFNIDEPEYTLELQFKSEYVENICKGEGIASHERRPGKKRVLPHATNNIELMRKLNYMVPKYEIFKREKGHLKVKEFDMLENVMGYYQGQIEPNSEEYEKIISILLRDNNKQKAI